MSKTKKKLGQFYTTNYEYILTGFKIPKDINKIIEPFSGKGDLLNFIPGFKEKQFDCDYKIECYDIEPKQEYIIKRDTLIDPPEYREKYIITNPPYLSRNKTEDKKYYNKYGVNDLYKCFIKTILIDKVLGGMIIIPLNFFSSIRKMDIELRKEFLEIYDIEKMNIFEERVFEDTSYTVCSIQFKMKNKEEMKYIPIKIFPSQKEMIVKFKEENNYTIGGEIYNLPQNTKYKISRLIKGEKPNTNILVKCIDDSKDHKISLRLVEDKEIFYDETEKKSERSYATLLITPIISKEKQEKLVELFNNFLNEKREEYNSLFLSNYRESTSIARKRISFDLVYQIVNYLLKDIDDY